eukprot:CAMPEP_0197440510 /NCGR_PEP_ID=MMETSP1175-20131217/7003_1 /TAXON_ID=1003142 /ORGANISM="Triceratium dubium, Strain CCMP147" /LENGTH=617 /DNA_ID=CAMNT_0042970633 /DNA_START=401 /DNA_END=2251 /DNA_ORIENTATION=+
MARTMLISRRKRSRRYHARAVIRSLAFIAVLIGYSAYSYYYAEDTDSLDSGTTGRELESSDPCEGIKKANPPWFAVIYFIGVLYLFLAIAIICDELFVPAIEEMSGERHLNLSMDVAGATLMAAGGSAPELFTSLFGTFVTEDEVGIGTVVGSAVFNVLFVIAMCALCSTEVLELTWWPLFRDSLYYSIGLVVLGVFVGVVSKGEIELWEAIVLFLMYIGYVVMMYFNQKIYKLITGKELANDASTEENGQTETGFQDEDGESDAESGGVESPPRETSVRSMVSAATSVSGNHLWPGTFHTGVLKLLRDPNSSVNSAGVGIVAQMAGDAGHVFHKVDIDGNGEIDKEELAQLFSKLEINATAEELDEIMRELDADNDGKISEKDFTSWYIKSEKRIKARVRTVFDHFDADHSGTINRSKIKLLLETVEPSVTDSDVDEAMKAMYKSGSKDEITFEEFSQWYLHSMIYNRQKKEVEEEQDDNDEEDETIFDSLKPPEKCGFLAWLKYIVLLPIVVVLAFTVPDVRKDGWGKFCYFSFFMSIVWIGVFSYFMVSWAEIIGNTIGIPPVIMGITLLAAGTSVPDLLSSVIVARMGEGDMALSSSIGSNIFDILVGLPIPW